MMEDENSEDYEDYDEFLSDADEDDEEYWDDEEYRNNGEFPFATPESNLLHEAAEDCSISCMQRLLDKGHAVHINARHHYREDTPLHRALSISGSRCPKMVKLLIENGADVNAKRSSGLVALHDACCIHGGLEIVKLLQQNGADVNAVCGDGGAPLHMACLWGYLEIAKYLVDNGADINDKGWTPLHWACLNGHLEVVQYLLSRGAKVSAERTTQGKTLLDLACEDMGFKEKNREIVWILLRQKWWLFIERSD